MSQDVAKADVTKRSLHETNWRWLALLFHSFLMFGGFYVEDLPQTIQTRFQETPFNQSNVQFNSLYSVYSFPNAILPFVGGLLIDRYGIRPMIIIFALIVAIGQGIFTLGVAEVNYSLMIIGRLVFALGGENYSMAQTILTTKWFLKADLAFALGITMVVNRSAMLFNSYFSPRLAESSDNLWYPSVVGTIICTSSCLCAIAATWMDYYSDKYAPQSPPEDSSTQSEGGQRPEESTFKSVVRDLFQLKFELWLVVLNLTLVYSSINTFIANANDILVQRFGFSEVGAGSILCIVYATTMVSPLFGLLIDKYDGKKYWSSFSAVIIFTAHLILAYAPSSQEPSIWKTCIPLLLFGLGYTIYSTVIWVMIPDFVEERLIGMSYGLATAALNSSSSLMTLLAGVLQDYSKEYKSGYFYSELLVAGLALGGLFVSLKIKNSKTPVKNDIEPCSSRAPSMIKEPGVVPNYQSLSEEL